MAAILLASGHALDKHFDPASVLGRRVRIEILLDWNLHIPEGVVQGVVELTPKRDALAYAVKLDSVMRLESRDLHPGGLVRSRRSGSSYAVDRVVVAIRRTEAAEEELQGGVISEFTAPLLYYVRDSENSNQKTMNTDRDLGVIGPCRIVVLPD